MLENPWSAVGNPTSALGPSGSSFGPSSLAPVGIYHLLLSNLTTGHGPVSVCLSVVCLSQVRVLSKRLNELSWFFGVDAFFHPSYTALKGNSRISKISALSCGTLSQTPDLEKILRRCIDRRNVLSSWKVDAESVINWTVVDQLNSTTQTRPDPIRQSPRTLSETRARVVEFSYKLTVPPSSDACPLVYHSNLQAVFSRIARVIIIIIIIIIIDIVEWPKQ